MVGNVPLQKRRALALSILIIALAQTSYIGALQGWTFVERFHDGGANYSNNCASESLGVGNPFHVDILNGSDLWAGTSNCPKSSISSAVENASSNDEIIVHAGRYYENITIDNKDNLLLRAASGERVVMDGTRSISEDFDATWTVPDADGIQEVTLPIDGWQLFLDWEEQVPARWPNAGFANDSVFNRSYWAGGTLTGTNNAYTNGWLQDAGPETGVHDGLNETINATGLDPVGAIAILNVGSFKSYSREITTWNASTGTFGYDVTPSWKTKHHAYFLEGKRELIDVDGEWWFNNTNNRLHYRPTTGDNANNLDLRVKVQPFAITIENSDDVTIQGIDFFGTTIDVNECDGCSFTNSTLDYPSTSRRGQGIADESEDDRFVTHFYRSTNTFVDRISITNTDGAALEFHGAGGQSYNNVVNNSYFYAIDWSASDQKGLMTTIYEGGRDMTFSNNTVHLTGASSVLSIGDSPTVLYNEVWDVGHLQTDGAVVQLMQGEVQGSEIAYNWIHDISKYGIRFDAPINQISTGNNGSIHHNVIWNASGGIMAKGDYHDISNNTVFGERVDGKNNIIILHEQNTGNENSTTWNNAVDAIAAHRSNTIWDYPLEDNTHGMNWNGYIHQYANSLSVFDTHTCAILENKSLACWGNNGNGQLGLGNTNSQSTPQYVDVGTGRTIKSIASSGSNSAHTCAILDNGSVMCWGANAVGQLGLGNTSTQESIPQYVDIGAGRTAIQLTTGTTHSCALLDNKSVSCWGSNAYRQLGIDSSIGYSSIPMHVDITAIEIHSAHLHTCAKLDNGSVVCWGYNNYGQMGLGNNTNTIDPPILIPLDSNREVTSIGIGKHHSCFTYDNGSIVCSGRNNVGQLGRGNTVSTNSFIYVPNLQGTSLQSALGSYQSCVLLINGSVQCWGANSWGQLGDGSQTQRTSPSSVILPVGREAVFVSMGHGHTCARLDNQSTACWGNNHHGQLGLGNNTDQSTPVIIPLLGNLATITVKDMLVDPDNNDFRPTWGSHLHRLDAGAYDADDSNPWTAGIEWTYSRSSNYTTGCMDSIALNYVADAGFDDGSCRYLEANLGERVAILNKAIEPITFTESLSNFDFGTWSTGVSNGTTAFSQSWRKPAGPGTDANYDFQDFAIAENGDQAIVFTQNHSGGSTPHSLALMYKPFNGSWSSSIIDNSTNTGFKPSIAIDRTGALHIAYIDNANDTIRYATNVSGSWAFSTLGDAEWTDSHSRKTDIAIHPITDAVYIVHTMKDVGDSGSALAGARFHTNEGGSWVNESITDRGLKSGYDPQIALDSDGNIHVSYYLDQGSDLKIASRIDGVWQNETVYGVDGINSGNTPAIAIDSQDVIHIIHMINHASNNKRLTLTSGTLGSWTNTTFGSSTLYRHSYNPSIAIDSNDAIHIAYHYGTTSKHLHYISNMTGSWSLETLDSSNAGWGARLSIDNNDDIHIAHSDLVGSGTIAHYLEMTKRTGSGEGLTAHPIFDVNPPLPDGLSMNWRNGTITGTPTEVQGITTYTVWANISERSASTSISIGVDWSLRPSVSGVSATLNTAITPITFEWNTTIWESRVTNGSDHPSSATSSNNAGKATDIAADSNGKTHVVSFDDNNDDLRYTTNAGGTWTSSLIHESGNTGRHPSIVIDSNDMIHVVFVRQTGSSLMYMNKSVSATSWSSATTISSDAWNKATGLALDEEDNLYVSWARADANYKRQCFVKTKPASSSTWSDLPGLYTHYQSENHRVRTACDVAVDSNKKVHIVAHDASSSSNSGDLRYTTNVSGSWVSSDIRDYSSSSIDTGRLVNLVIDSNDKIHLTYIETYGTAKAYHESNVGGSWSRSELAWYADFPAIAIDSNDDLHIALGSSGGISLHQRAAGSTGSFSSSTQTTCTGGCDEYISIIADNNDDLHLAFARHLNDKLGVSYEQGSGKGVKNDPGSWRPVISSISSCEVSPSLPQGLSVTNSRCTLSGTPSELSNNQTYTVWANTSSGDSYSTQVWLRVVHSPPSISYNSNNFILTNNTTMSPNAIPTNSGGPIPSRIIDVGSVGSYTSWGISNDTSIAMDSNGYMHISYRDSTNKTLLYATDKSGSWVTTTVDSEYGSGDESSIALDSNNNVHIVHFESDEYRLRYTTNMSGSWVSSRIVATTSVLIGFSPSIALDSDDNIHVSYMQAESAYRIKYATNSSGSWVDTTVSPTTTDCSFVNPSICHLAPNAFYTTTSIALDSNDKPHISYTCSGTVASADLCLTTNASGSWSYQTLDSSGNTGFDNSLSIDSDNYLHISYYDATNENLRYATNKSSSWVYSSIDQTGDVGHDTSLGIDSDNNVHISYYDKTNRDLKYATNSSGVWVNSTIDSNLDVGTGSSIFIESNDRVHISYQESVSDTDGNLRYIIVDNNNSIYGWSINSTLPDGLEFNENTGIISGTPTQLMSTTQYTIQARNSGGVSTATISIRVNDVAPGPFEYIPENNTITNNSLVHLAPYFIDTTSGNGSTWQVATQSSPGVNFELVVNDIIYFDANQNKRLYAFNPQNDTAWRVNSSLTAVGEYMAYAIDDVLYFSAFGAGLGNEFWAYNTTNDTVWQVADINAGSSSSKPGHWLDEQSGELIFFRAETSSCSCWRLHVFNASNQTVWEVTHSFSAQFGYSGSSKLLSKAIGDTVYFAAKDASSSHYEPFAYTVSNNTVWMIADIYSGSASYGTEAGHNLAGVVNDILLFDAWDGSESRTLWAHDPSNGTTWEISSSDSTRSDGFISANDCDHDGNNRLRVFVYGDTGYFCAGGSGDGDELWAYNTSNTTAWLVADINPAGNSNPGRYMFERIGDTLYFSATSTQGTGLWAHDTSNSSTWLVASLIEPGRWSSLVVGDTVYFSVKQGLQEIEPWAYDTSNQSTYLLKDINPGSSPSWPGLNLDFTLVGDVIYFDANDGTSVSLWGHRPSVINYQTNTGGDVTSWVINASLPSGLSFGTNNGTVYGTPTELWTQTSYLVWANNSGGSSVSILNITVVDEVPTLSYSPSTLEFTNNTAHVAVPLDATLTGSGTIISWAINGTLPNGINFGTLNGTIWGTPTELWNSTIYTVWANNSGGSTSTTITISVVDQLPGLNISPENTTATNNTAITTIVITTVGPGEIDTWELEGELPDGLTWTSANQTIWGTPTELMATTQYTVWANNTGGSVSATLNITVNDRVPGPFEYNPENNTWTNNTEVHLAPQFINQTTGNGSIWQVADIMGPTPGSKPGQYMEIVVGDIIYFGADDGSTGIELWAHNTSNATTWQVADIRSGSSSSNPGSNMMKVINGVLYFNAVANGGQELWKHDPSTGTTARVYDINPGSSGSSVGMRMSKVVGDVLYFSANDGSSGHELWAYNPSNSSNPWRVMDINSGYGSSNPGHWLETLVGDTLYFSADDGSTGHELWAHDTSNHSTWQVTDIYGGSGDGNPGRYMQILVGDTIYFSAFDFSTGDELWAHDTSNGSTWRVADIHTGTSGSEPGMYMSLLVGDTIYFDAAALGGTELWAHDISNHSTWRVVDIYTGSIGSDPGDEMALLVGDTLYFSATDGSTGTELWAHDTSNHSTWRVADIRGALGTPTSSYPGQYMGLLIGDTLYFSATDGGTGYELWAHDTSNHSTWQASDIRSGSSGSNPGQYMGLLIGDTLYFSAMDGSTGHELWAYRPSIIDYNTNTGGAVTSWAINASLPSGVSFGNNNGTIYGTPTELWTQTSYMVWANNSGGSSVAYLNITVNDQVPGLNISPENTTATNNTAITTIVITTVGPGEIDTWELEGTLPNGLTWTSANQTIWGTPTSLMTLKTFTIWANNSGGSVNATVNITVNDEAPEISYNPDWFELTNNTAMSPTATPTNSGGAVPSTVIDSTGSVGWHTSIAIDSNGYKHISYRDASPSIGYDLKYATDTTGSWVTVSVDTTGDVGMYTSIAIDSNDVVHISYFDATNSDLKYATCSSGCTTASNWDDVAVDTTGLVGWHTSIAIDSNDAIHISYRDGTNYDLKYATCSSACTTASNWDDVSVDTSPGSMGYDTSIAIDSNDAIHISYRYYSSGNLMYATCSSGCTTASNWDKVEFTTTGQMGWYTSIAIDSNDAVHISSFDQTNNNLKYATCSSGCTTVSNWNEVAVDTDNLGDFSRTAIAIDSNDAVHISYYDYSNHDLKYAACSSGCTTASNWDKVSVDTTGDVGHFNSIAIDSNDAVHISYFDDTNDDLKYIGLDSSSNILFGYSVSPDLPAGLSLNIVTGEISGTPTALSTNTTYTITVRNSGGTNTTTITIEVLDQLPGLNISPENTTATNNTAITTIVITTVGPGEIDTWELEGELPDGLTWTSANQTIWGTPTELMTTTQYTVWANNTGGSVSATLNITVNDQVPGLNISPENTTATNNTAISTITITTVGPGEIDTWELEGTLPTGLTWTSANQTIWGTPTELMTTTPYTVWANNSGGGISSTFNITVNDQLPGLNISPENTTATNNTAITTIVITTVGLGEITSWELEGSLPSGLTWTPSNQTIWGTPTELMTVKEYTVWANNSGGSISANLNITVNDQLPISLTITPENTTATNNTEITTIAITTVGPGDIVTWELEGSLPSGLTWTPANQTIWGTPTELMTTTQYTIWANNTGGDVSATLNITVNHVISGGIIISPTENTTATNNTGIPSITFSSTGPGEIVTWELQGTLPSGLTWTPANQTIWGTPTELMTTTQYSIWANNTGGSVSATLNITVNDQVPGLNISPENTTATNNTAITTIAITTAGSGEIDTWELEGALPTGLTWTSANQTIWGTPTELTTTTQYTVWANNTGGSVSVTLNITVNDQVPGLNISPENTTATNNTSISTITITTVGPGEIDTWELEGTLPTGLIWTSANQTIWGTPTELTTTTQYTVWANNTGGSVSATLNITVNDEVPTTLSYSNPDLLLTNNTAMTPHDPITTGPGTVVTWDIVGELPQGITFNSTTGIISGTPTELMTTTQYTIWANNTGGSISTLINITVVDQLPSLTYPLISLDLVVNTINSDIPFEPSLSGPGEIISWEMVGELPSGMQFNTSTGMLSGIPTELWSTANYTIWANNTGGSVDFSFSLTVVDRVPNEIGYSDVNLTLTNNTAMSPEQPLIIGSGTITSWVIIGELPEGISFNESTGEISGTPTELWPITPYTVWANNSGGSVFVEFNISVIAIEPSISYNSNALTLTVGVAMTPLESLSTGGVIASWEAYPELPDGISIDLLTGYISGTPTTLQSPQSYTIWANNTGGITTFELSISIIDVPASIDISPDSIVLTIGDSMSPAQIGVSGGQVIEWGIHPELPNGLLFDTTNLSITGMPSELIPETLYTIWANNSGGSQTTSISITVIDILPTIDYVDEHVFYSNVSGVLIEPIVSGGAILNYSIDNDLVNGLLFDYSNGSIVGIPSEVLPRTQFTITVSNSGGSAVATLNITVLPSVGCMDPLAENYDSVAIQDSGLCIYTDTDGDGVSDINEIEGCTDLDAVNYIPTATEDDGSCVPRLSVIYPEYSIILIVGQNNVSILPEVLGQTVEIWSIEPSLPEPLEFNYLVENGVLTVGKGSISGIPLQPLNLSNYTILAIDEDTNQSVSIRIYLQILEDTDGDGKPNVGSDNWIEDLDDDNDGYLDSIEEKCNSDPKNAASIPDLDSEGNCIQEEVSETEEPLIPETTANLYYWCILPLAIILAVMLFSLISRQRNKEEENKDSELDEHKQPLELT